MPKTNKEYLRLWRKRNKKKVRDYDRARQPINTSRKRARRKLEKELGKERLRNRDVHHKDNNANNNGLGNLGLAKRYHGYKKKRKYRKR